MAVTTTKGIIRMPDEGDTLTMHVAKCEVVEGQFGEQVKFTDTRGDQLFISRASADRQLGRIGFVDGEMVIYGDVDGNTLVFSRDHNPKGKPYWGISRVVPADDARNRPPLKAAAQAEAERVRKAKGLPKDDGGSMGPYIPGLDDDPDDPGPADPYADDDGMPPVKAVSAPQKTLTAEQANKEGAINAAYARAYAFVLGVQGKNASPESVTAGASTLLISYKQSGIV
jgi:hypothetical protein